MGIVSKQATTATILSYLGVVIGFVNVALLMNRWFSPEEFGLRSILLDFAIFYSQIAHLGTYRSLVKFFPFFNREGKNDNGLLGLGLVIPLIGFIAIGLVILLIKPEILSLYQEKSPLFVEYFWLGFPLAFLMLYNNVFESYLQSRAKTAYSVFLKSVLNRVIVSLLLVVYYFGYIDFHGFIVYFILSYGFNALLFIIYLIRRGEFSLRLNTKLFTRKVRKVYYNYSLYSILSGVSSVLVNKIDSLMLGHFLGLASTAIYSNAFYLSILINIPADSIGKIAFPLLSRNWKEKRMDKILDMYQKTSINQYLIGGGLFVLMWCSIDNFFSIQRPEYVAGKYVLLLLGIARIVNMVFGVNGQIINVSKFYRFDTTTSILLAILTVITNLIFIPIWGIVGAAGATALSIVIFNLIRFFYVYAKLNIQPFTIDTIRVSGILLLGLGLGKLLPFFLNIYVDTLYRSIAILLVMGVPTYYFKVSEDLNRMIDKSLKLIKLK